MDKRVFICGYYNFPRGSSSANYVQYLAEIFLKLKYKIIIVSNINEEELQRKTPFINHNSENISLEPIQLGNGKVSHYYDFNFNMGNIIKQILKRYGIKSNDILISYSMDPFVNRMLVKMGKQSGAKTCACIVEWFTRQDFEKGIRDLEFYRFNWSFYFILKRFNYLFPISTYIEQYYVKHGCKTMCLPIMADPEEYDYKVRKDIGVKKIIYPANGKLKDAIDAMLRSLNQLSDEDINKIEFHICGVSPSMVEKQLSDRRKKYMGSHILVHPWMKYEELIALYQQMHFLFLPREVNQMTLANFPSKAPETMCYGVIPVVSDVGDYTKYYLRDNINSIIFNGADSDTCTSVLSKIANMSNALIQELSAQARNTAVNKFGYKNWIEKIENFLSLS